MTVLQCIWDPKSRLSLHK